MLTTTGGFAELVASTLRIFNQLIPVLVALALVLFMIGIIRYIRSGNEKKNRTEIMWSLVALFVLFSVWGILRIACASLVGTPSCNPRTAVDMMPYDI